MLLDLLSLQALSWQKAGQDRSHCICPPTWPKCCCPAMGSARGGRCRDPTGGAGMALAQRDSGLWKNHIMVCSAATLQNQITTFQSSDLVLLHPTRYKIIPLCSQKPTLSFSFDTSIPLILYQWGQKHSLSRTRKKYPSK